jgi:DNA helicase HerA-like ATPase
MIKSGPLNKLKNSIKPSILTKVSLNPPGLNHIGRTIVSDKFPITMDTFWITINSNVVVNPFDFITVENFHNTKTIGIVKELQSIAIYEETKTESINDNVLNIIKSPEQLQGQKSLTKSFPTSKASTRNSNRKRSYSPQSPSTVIAKVAVMANTGVKIDGTGNSISINMPIAAGKPVDFATAEEIIFSLGIPEMENPIPAGLIQTTNGLQVPITLDISYLAGPDTVHVNASGISGNQKSTYLLFLLQSAYQKLRGENVSLIIFNTKQAELLQIHKRQKNEERKTDSLFDILDLESKPFDKVTYFLPRGINGKPNSSFIPEKYRTYSYELKDVYDKLDLLLPDAYDPQYNLSSIINYVNEAWPIKDSTGKVISTWRDLYEYEEYPQNIVSHKSSLLHFRSYLQRFRKSALFTDKKVTSTYLGNKIKKIKSGDVFVIDLGTISSLVEQSFIVGDVMKNVDEMYSSREELDNHDDNHDRNKNKIKKRRPKYMLIFIDEINRFVPKSHDARGINPVAEQIMRTVVAGGARETILFSAQQFKSATDYRLHENTGLHITAKLGLSELSTQHYSMLDESTKKNITRLNRGELIMIHSAFRHPIKISFPKGAYMRLKQ